MTAMGLTLGQAKKLWSELRIAVDDGLSQTEFRRIEGGLKFSFNADHRVLLASGLPRGGRWPDWRGAEPEELKQRLAEPVEGVLFDVEENGFWHRSWGRRPAELKEALRLAKSKVQSAPLLVPIYGHRYSPALPQPNLPVFSVVQTDVIVYGSTIEEYLRREFGSEDMEAKLTPADRVPFWSDLVAVEEH